MITPIAAATVLRRSRLGTIFRSGLRRRLEGAQRLGRALNPHSMILTLIDCVDPDISTSTSVIPPIPLPHTAIPSRRPRASKRAGPMAEMARVSGLLHQQVGTRRIRGTVKRRGRTTRRRDTMGMATRKLRTRWDRQRKGVRPPLRGRLRRTVASNVTAGCRLSEIKLSAVKVGVECCIADTRS